MYRTLYTPQGNVFSVECIVTPSLAVQQWLEQVTYTAASPNEGLSWHPHSAIGETVNYLMLKQDLSLTGQLGY